MPKYTKAVEGKIGRQTVICDVAAPATAAEPGLLMAVGELGQAVSDLEVSLTNLVQKLQPVMGKSEESPVSQPVRAATCSLDDSLLTQLYRLRQLVCLVRQVDAALRL